MVSFKGTVASHSQGQGTQTESPTKTVSCLLWLTKVYPFSVGASDNGNKKPEPVVILSLAYFYDVPA